MVETGARDRRLRCTLQANSAVVIESLHLVKGREDSCHTILGDSFPFLKFGFPQVCKRPCRAPCSSRAPADGRDCTYEPTRARERCRHGETKPVRLRW